MSTSTVARQGRIVSTSTSLNLKNNRKRNLRPLLASVLAVPLASWFALPHTAKAQTTLFWDPTMDGSTSGGTGTWGDNVTGASNWWTGSVDQQWNDANGDLAIFNGTGDVVVLDGARTAGSLTFNVDGYTLSGNSIFLTTGNVNVSLGTATIASTLGGSNGLSLNSPGSLVLAGAANYSGATTINNGALVGGATNALPTGTAVTVSGPGVLDLGGFNQTIGSVTGNGGVVLNGVLTTGGDNTNTAFSGLVSGTGNLIKTGGGTFTLSSSNNFTGATSVNNGVLSLTDPKATGSSSGITVAGGAQLQISGANSFNSGVPLTLNGTGISNDGALRKTGANVSTYAGTVTFNTNGARVNSDAGTLVLSGTQSGSTTDAQYGGTGNMTVSGVIDNTINHVNYDGSGTLTLAGNNTFTGGMVVTGGGLVSFSRSAGNVGPNIIGTAIPNWLSLGGGSTFQSTTTGTGSTFLDTNKGITLTTGGGTISSTDPTGTNVTIYRGLITGVGPLTKTGSGGISINRTETYTGATTVAQGFLRLRSDSTEGPTIGPGALPSATALTVNSGATFDIATFSQTIASLSGAGSMLATNNSGGTLTLGDATNKTFSGSFLGSAGNVSGAKLTKVGSGDMVLSGTYQWNGAVTLNAGRLFIGDPNVSGTGTTGQRLIVNNQSATLAGGIFNGAGTASVTKMGTGTLSLTSTASTWGGVDNYLLGGKLSLGATGTASGGSLFLGNSPATSTPAYLTIDNGAILDLNSVLPTTSVTMFTATKGVTIGSGGGTVRQTDTTVNGIGIYNNNWNGSSVGAGTLTIDAAAGGANTEFRWVGPNTPAAPIPNTFGKLNVVSGFVRSGNNTSEVYWGAIPTSFMADQITLSNNAYIGSSVSISFNANRGVTLGTGGGGIDVTTGVSLTFNGAISGAAGLTAGSFRSTVSDNGFLILNAAETFTGTLNVGDVGGNAGQPSVQIGNSGTIGSLTTASVVLNPSTTAGCQSRIFFARTDGYTYNGTISGTGTVTQTGSGTLTLSNASNSWNGSMTIAAGILRANDGSTLPTNALLNITGGVFESSGNMTRALGATAASNLVQITGGTSGFSAISNPITVSIGGLATPTNLTWGSTSFAPSTFVLNSANANAGLTLNNNIDLNNATRTFQVNANIATLAGIISNGTGTGNLTKNGAGVLVLNQNETYNGNTTITAGTLRLGVANAIPSGGALTATQTFDMNSLDQTVGSISGAGPINNMGQLTVGGLNTNTTYSGVASGAGGSLIKNGTGLLAMTGANTYGGDTTLNSGILQVNGTSTLGNQAGIFHLAGGTFQTSATRTASSAPIANPISIEGNATVATTSTAGTVDLNFTNNNIAGSNANTLTIINNAASGTGVFQPRFSGSFSLDSNIAVQNGSNGSTIFQSFNTTSNGSQTFTGVISGSGGYKRSASTAGTGGTTIFTNANTYTGGTTISDGTLLVNNNSGSGVGSGNVSVTSGGTLGGSGFIGAPVAINSGGKLAPGNSAGTLTINSDLTLNSGANLNYDINSANTVGGGINDLTAINGNLNLLGNLSFNLNAIDSGNLANATYTLLTYTGALTGDVSGWSIGTNNAIGSHHYNFITSNPNEIDLVVTGPGQNLFYVGPASGNWNTGTNWSLTPGGPGTAGVPVDTDSAFVQLSSNTTVNFNGDYSNSAGLFGVDISGTSGGIATLNHNTTNTMRTTGAISLGTSAGTNGIYNLSNDGAVIAASMVVGDAGTGTLNVASANASVNVGGNMTVGNTGVGTVDHSAGTVNVANTLVLGLGGGNGSYLQSGGTLNSASLRVGDSGNGTFTQSGGSNTTSNLLVANTAASTSTYNLTGPGSLSASSATIGGSGNGSLSVSDPNASVSVSGNMVVGSAVGSLGSITHSAGLVNVSGALILGQDAGSNASYSLSGGTLNSSAVFVGSAGKATFTQTGGTNTTGVLTVGNNGSGIGIYNLSGPGSLSTSGDLTVGNSGTGSLSVSDPNASATVAGNMNVGNNSGAVGSVTQSAGLVSVNGILNLAGSAGSNASYTLSGGTANSSSTIIGNAGNATFTQTGGSHTTGTLALGNGAGSNGVYNLSGPGSVSAGVIAVGNNGSGALNVSDPNASVTASGNMVVGNVTGPGAVTQSNGSVTVNGTLFVGLVSGASGAYTQSGGTLNAVTGASIGDANGTSASFTLSGGSFNDGFIAIGNAGNGTLTQTGGSHTSGSVVVGNVSTSTGTYSLSGPGSLAVSGPLTVANAGNGTLTISDANASITTTGNMIVGSSSGSTGSVTHSAGSVAVGGTLYIGNNTGSTGSYSISGSGTASASAIALGVGGTGTLNHMGGAVTTNTLAIGNNVDVTTGTGAGHVNLSGGTLNANTILIGSTAGGSGDMTWSGGQLNTSNLTIAQNGSMALSAGQNKTLVLNSLAITGNGVLDLSDNPMIVTYSAGDTTHSVRDQIRNLLKNGRNGGPGQPGAWNGTGGISSSYANANGNGFNLAVGYGDNTDLALVRGSGSYTSFGGQTVSSNTVLVQMTRGADATLDGVVDAQDVTILGSHFNKPNSGQWVFGDFDYSGTCDATDVTTLGATFGKTSPTLSPAQMSAEFGSAFTNAFEGGQTGAVPEPASLTLLGLGGLALMGRRQRRRGQAGR